VRNAVVTASLDPSRRDRALAIVRRGTDQLARLVDDLLDVARITQGKIGLRRERVRFASVVERAVETTRQLVEERAHRLTVSLPQGALEVDGDQTRLEQVVGNLITNAAKYTESGGRIEVTVEHHGDEAVLSVRDNGAGIAPDVLPRVFDLFTQGERGLERAPGGLGIGLTVVRRITELHGGRVEAHSDGLGTGAQFIVRLPALAPAPESDAPASAEQPVAAPRHARVLLVEDNADAAEGMMLFLEILGHRVHVVHDGTTALDIARSFRPVVMLVDIGLPGIDGYVVARRARQDPGLAHLTLVALTGYGSADDKRRAAAAGFDHHLTKPVELEALSTLLAALPPAKGERSTLH
jgi:CheY-like chemotaxis protein/two-component sensor histidine kinase